MQTPIDRPDSHFSLRCEYRLPAYEHRTLWQTDYTLNSLGLRDAEIPAAKAPGDYRILFMGDSCTFGVGDWIAPEGTYVKIAEKLLQQKYPRRAVRTMNAGIPGYSSFQGYQLLRSLLPAYAPDAVAVYYGWNDHWVDFFDEKEKYALSHVDYMLNSSRLFTLVKRLVLGNDQYFSIKHSKLWTAVNKRKKVRLSATAYQQTILKIIRLCRKNGVRVVLLTAPAEPRNAQPNVGWFAEQPFFTFQLHPLYNQIIRQTAAQEQVDLIDLASLFDRDKDIRNFSDFVHPSKQGQRLIGRYVSDYFYDRGIIEGSRGPRQ